MKFIVFLFLIIGFINQFSLLAMQEKKIDDFESSFECNEVLDDDLNNEVGIKIVKPKKNEIVSIQQLAKICCKKFQENFYGQPVNGGVEYIFDDAPEGKPSIKYSEIISIFSAYKNKMINFQEFNSEEKWCSYSNIDEKIKISHEFWESKSGNDLPYVMKHTIEDNSEICFIGDIHGSFQSITRIFLQLIKLGYLNDDFTFAKKNFHMIFLGDCVDRGFGGVEVIYSLMRLKLANWDNVFIMRGNHEDIDLSSVHGFKEELFKKYGKKLYLPIWHEWITWTGFLPFALFLNTTSESRYLHISHGGIGFGNGEKDPYDPKIFLNQEEKIFQKISLYGEKGFSKIQGFNWSDIKIYPKGLINENQRGAGFCSCYLDVEKYLDTNQMVALFKGHQDKFFGLKMFSRDHLKNFWTDDQNGDPICWKDVVDGAKDMQYGDSFSLVNKDKYVSIYTLTTASSSAGYYDLDHDFFAILQMQGNSESWNLFPYEIYVGIPKDRYKKWMFVKEVKEDNKNVIFGFSEKKPRITGLDKLFTETN